MEETGVSEYKQFHSDDAIKSFVSERLNDTVIAIVNDVDAEEEELNITFLESLDLRNGLNKLTN